MTRFLLLTQINQLTRVIAKLQTALELQIQMQLPTANTYRLLMEQRGKLVTAQEALFSLAQ